MKWDNEVCVIILVKYLKRERYQIKLTNKNIYGAPKLHVMTQNKPKYTRA